MLAPARFRFVAGIDAEPEGAAGDGPVIPVPSDWLARLRQGDLIDLHDTRAAARQLRVESSTAGVATMSVADTTYLGTGTTLTAPDDQLAEVGLLPAAPNYLTLHRGDELILSRDCTPAPVGEDVALRIGCTLPEVFDHIGVGDLAHFDDGRITGRVIAVTDDEVTVRITAASARGSRLRAGKGINLPETALAIPALTATDRSHLDFVAGRADIVELSFARSADDVEDLLGALDELGAQDLGVVVKIETARAFANLPDILFALMRRPRVGGDDRARRPCRRVRLRTPR